MMIICLLYYVLCIIHVITGDTVILKTTDSHGEACVSNEPQHVVPIYDLKTFKGTSRSNGLLKWTDKWRIDGAEISEGSYLWQLDNFAKWNDVPQFVSNGSRGYESVYYVESHQNEDYLHLSVLSNSMSILLTSQKNWVGKNGFVIELDNVHLNGTFQSTIKSCIDLETINENCTIISSKNVQQLCGGQQWVFLLIKFKLHDCENRLVSIEGIQGDDFLLTYHHADSKECGEFSHENWMQVYAAIKSTQPGIFKIHKHPYLTMKDEEPIKLQRRIEYSGDGIFCLKVRFERSKPTSGIFLVKEATFRKMIFNKTIFKKDELDWEVRLQAPLDAGAYNIELLITTRGEISDVSYCRSARSGIQVVEASEGKLIGCQTLIWNETMPGHVIYAPELKGIHSKSDDSGFDRISLSLSLLLVSTMMFTLTFILWLNDIVPDSRPSHKIKHTA